LIAWHFQFSPCENTTTMVIKSIPGKLCCTLCRFSGEKIETTEQ
jgi:hypothetical protein